MSNAFSFGVPVVPYQPQERAKTIPPAPPELFVVPHIRVLNAVCAAYDLTPNQLTGPERWSSFCLARFTAYWLLRTVCKLSFPQIGRIMGNRDHTTIMSGVKKAEQRRARDSLYTAQTDGLAERVKGGVT